jgi:hypothetical protein
MNFRGKQRHGPLNPCPKCHMDAGQRKVREGIEEQYFVVCGACGYRTKPHKNQSAASKEWNEQK